MARCLSFFHLELCEWQLLELIFTINIYQVSVLGFLHHHVYPLLCVYPVVGWPLQLKLASWCFLYHSRSPWLFLPDVIGATLLGWSWTKSSFQSIDVYSGIHRPYDHRAFSRLHRLSPICLILTPLWLSSLTLKFGMVWLVRCFLFFLIYTHILD